MRVAGWAIWAFVVMAAGASGVEGQPAGPAPVKVEWDAGRWILLRDGRPYAIRGAGGSDRLDLLAELGGNSIRTWGVRQLEERDAEGGNLLDRAHEMGLSVTVGLWVQQPRHGFNYNDPAQIEKQRESIRAAVRRFKDHPALLIWGLGNEVEIRRSPEEYPKLYAELNALARIVKEEDPNHPVMTVIAGAAESKIRAIKETYSEIDILGINAYKGAPEVPSALREVGWTKPYVLTEFGPDGPWETPKTAWGAPLEPAPSEKMRSYEQGYRANVEGRAGQCLGSYAFIWGSKQEATSSWFGLLLPSTREKTPAVDVLSHLWTGRWPDNRSPVITAVRTDFEGRTITPGTESLVAVEANDAEGDVLQSEAWVMAEAKPPAEGGDKESVPERLDGCLVLQDGLRYTFRAPERPGAYRLFVKVVDGRGGGSMLSLPFQVQQ